MIHFQTMKQDEQREKINKTPFKRKPHLGILYMEVRAVSKTAMQDLVLLLRQKPVSNGHFPAFQWNVAPLWRLECNILASSCSHSSRIIPLALRYQDGLVQ